MEWISIKDKLPENESFVLACSNEQPIEMVDEILDMYLDKKVNKETAKSFMSPILSVQYKFIDGCSTWLYPNIFEGGLIDFSESITHWMPLPELPKE